jgi:hypothetical protein
VLFPDIGARSIIAILIGGSMLGILLTAGAKLFEPSRDPIGACRSEARVKPTIDLRDNWRMPPLDTLPPVRLSLTSRIWMTVLRLYLVVSGGLVLVRIIQLATVGA